MTALLVVVGCVAGYLFVGAVLVGLGLKFKGPFRGTYDDDPLHGLLVTLWPLALIGLTLVGIAARWIGGKR